MRGYRGVKPAFAWWLKTCHFFDFIFCHSQIGKIVLVLAGVLAHSIGLDSSPEYWPGREIHGPGHG
jgi:hypothetical protein